MPRSLRLLLTTCVLAFALACGGAEPDSAASPDSQDQGGMLSGLLDKAKGMMGSSDGEASDASAAADPIVRCEVNGSVSFTHLSNCPSGIRMALKAKNAP